MKRLETSRTYLKPFEEKDLPLIRRLMTDESVMKHTGFGKVQPEEVIQERMAKWVSTANSALGVLGVFDKLTDEFIGWFMLQLKGGEHPEIGFMLVKGKWKQGYATEVAREILRHGLEDLKYQRIVAYASSENAASLAVLQKIGMSRMPNPGESKDLIYFEKS